MMNVMMDLFEWPQDYQIKNPAESKEEPGACYVGLIHNFFFLSKPMYPQQ